MTAVRPAVDPAGLYSLTEAAKALGIDRKTLLRYRKELLIHTTVHRATMRVKVKGREILRFWERTI